MRAARHAAPWLALLLWGLPWALAQSEDRDLRAADEAFQEGAFEEAEVRYRELIDKYADNHAVQFRYGYCLHNAKKYAEAVKLFEQAAADEQLRGPALYNLACGYALLGQTNEACEALDRAIDGGFNDARLLKEDADLQSIRGDDRYRRALEHVEAFGQRPPLTWERLPERLRAAEQAGFSGALLVVRDGQVALQKGFGLADAATSTANTPETIFAIGSTPIDFTKAAILLLAERSKLALDDPISKFFDAVPEDKQAITIEQLMTGRSGLRDFHDQPGDRDPDHAWIDRDEAVRRILAQELLFEPGKDSAHSHSAWGLLAAIVEKVSGQTYPEFTTEQLFKPAGMNDTGFFGTTYDPQRMAVGRGPKSDGEINAPPYWGPTSWLVMGSGGQYSTVGDLNRWLEALRAGKILNEESLAKYFNGGLQVLAGGDMYGFEIVYTTGPRNRFILMSNDNQARRSRSNRRLADELVTLMQGGFAAPPFTLGAMLDIDDEGRASLTEIAGGGPAARAGLKQGDVLVSIDGEPIGPNPRLALRPFLAQDAKFRLGVERDGQPLEVEIKPIPRPQP